MTEPTPVALGRMGSDRARTRKKAPEIPPNCLTLVVCGAWGVGVVGKRHEGRGPMEAVGIKGNMLRVRGPWQLLCAKVAGWCVLMTVGASGFAARAAGDRDTDVPEPEWLVSLSAGASTGSSDSSKGRGRKERFRIWRGGPGRVIVWPRQAGQRREVRKPSSPAAFHLLHPVL